MLWSARFELLLSGAVLTHGQCAVATTNASVGLPFTEPGKVLSFLPLSHIYGVGVVQLAIRPMKLTNMNSALQSLPHSL